MLSEELRDTLACVMECDDIHRITHASDVLLEIVKLVIQSASILDDRVQESKTSEKSVFAVINAILTTFQYIVVPWLECCTPPKSALPNVTGAFRN